MQTAAVKNEGDQPSSLALGDHVFNKLLKERIIWLGSEVAEDNANQICAQMMLLAAQTSRFSCISIPQEVRLLPAWRFMTPCNIFSQR